MDRSEARNTVPEQGGKQFVFRPPADGPDQWELDEQGRPLWLPLRAAGRWVTVWEKRSAQVSFRLQMPALRAERQVRHRFGRPRKVDSDPHALDQALWLHDFHGRGHTLVADELAVPRSTARGWITLGHQYRHEQGALPWAAWPEGNVPDGWWREETFGRALEQWWREAVQDATVAPLRRTLQQLGDVLRRTRKRAGL